MTVDFCSNIENYTDDPIYSEVEQEVLNRISALYFNKLFYAQVMNFNNVISLTENFVPIILAFYIGSWSDKFGRKPFIALFMVGKLLGLIGTMLGGIFLDEMSKWVWLGIVMPVTNLSGGVMTFILMTYSFAADNSSPR